MEPKITTWVEVLRANGLPAEGSGKWQKSVVRGGSDGRAVLALWEEWWEERPGFHSWHGTEHAAGEEGDVGENGAPSLHLPEMYRTRNQGKRQ